VCTRFILNNFCGIGLGVPGPPGPPLATPLGHEKKLFKRRFRLDTRKFVFSNRVVDNWTALSAQTVNSCTINRFK